MNATLNPEQKVALSDDVLLQNLAGESVLLNLKTESYFGLDEIGTRMLTALQDAPSIQAAGDRLVDEYDVPPDQLRTDLLQLIERLLEHELVRVTGP